ncbi:hypothetical protein Q5W_15370 [Hydrogenophaga sp. PBC]|uniref:hypothetical protein n=1 Tax=Hydrogenophaga sp. PBC TaxID=795665 RepID=UPI0002606DDD|nr:hypothetical protein [Hydrogenophaga sp. PBC]AOS80249.1 hypothetical protein Q5W_15370 [Hydrogenophaga sp. PBC]
MNPIQQAISALEDLLTSEDFAQAERYAREVLTSLRSLQKKVEGVELPSLPAPTWGEKATGWAYHKDDMRAYARTAIAAALGREGPGSAAWKNSEGWESLAWELCADENGEESCNELIWEGGPVPEPWGERWLKYEDEAKRLIALVQKHVRPAAPTPEATQPTQAEAPSDKNVWRDLALQFDNHRMQALGWLRMAADELPRTPAWSALRDFIAAPPLSGAEVLQQRVAALATQQAGQGEAPNGWRETVRAALHLLNDTQITLGRFLENHRNPSEKDTVNTLLGLHDTNAALRTRRELSDLLATPPAPQQPEAQDYYVTGPYVTGTHAGFHAVAELATGRVVHFFKLGQQPEALAQQERELTDEQIDAACSDVWLHDFDSQLEYDRAVARAAICAARSSEGGE